MIDLRTAKEAGEDASVIEAVADALESTDVGYSMRLTRMVDGVHTYELDYGNGEPKLEFASTDEVYEHVGRRKRASQAKAAIDAYLSALPKLPGEGDAQLDACHALLLKCRGWLMGVLDSVEDSNERQDIRALVVEISNLRQGQASTPTNAEATLVGAWRDVAKRYMLAVARLGEQSGYNRLTFFEAPISKMPNDELGMEAVRRWQELNDAGKALAAAVDAPPISLD